MRVDGAVLLVARVPLADAGPGVGVADAAAVATGVGTVATGGGTVLLWLPLHAARIAAAATTKSKRGCKIILQKTTVRSLYRNGHLVVVRFLKTRSTDVSLRRKRCEST